MERTQSTDSVALPIAAIVLASGAALFLGLSSALTTMGENAEMLSTGSWLLGWALLVWSAVLGGASVVVIVRRAIGRRTVSRSEIGLVTLACALAVVVVSAHPLWGSGAGAA